MFSWCLWQPFAGKGNLLWCPFPTITSPPLLLLLLTLKYAVTFLLFANYFFSISRMFYCILSVWKGTFGRLPHFLLVTCHPVCRWASLHKSSNCLYSNIGLSLWIWHNPLYRLHYPFMFLLSIRFCHGSATKIKTLSTPAVHNLAIHAHTHLHSSH